MVIRYDIKASIANKNNGTSSSFPAKTLETEVVAENDSLLYNNNHVIAENVYLFDIFKDEVQTYSNALGVPINELEFDSFEVTALAPPEKYQVYFEFDSDKHKQDLRPTIKVYIGPKNNILERPVLKGDALDKNSILWSWDESECAHYLVTEAIDPDNPDDRDKIIAQLPIGVKEYVETGLKPDTAYTHRLIAYTDEQYSEVSKPCTVRTETESPDIILQEYETPKLFDFTIDESQRDVIEDRMKAFHSGVGDFTDLQVYKQMDADFYQKFKAYFEITGRRVQRERRYDQIGFWYKVCLDAYQRIQEQEGEVTFDVYAYPREWLRLQDYVWTVEDVEVQAEFEASVFLQKKNTGEQGQTITVQQCVTEEVPEITDKVGTWHWTVPGTPGTPGTGATLGKYQTNGPGTYKYKFPDSPGGKTFIADPLGVIIVIDKTKSLRNIGQVDILKEAACQFVTNIYNLYDSLKKSGATIEEPLFAVITFADDDDGDGIDEDNEAKVIQYMVDANGNKGTAEKTEQTIMNINFDGDYTCWSNAIERVNRILNGPDIRNFAVLFFSDGGSNRPKWVGSDDRVYSNFGGYAHPTNSNTTSIITQANALTRNSKCVLSIPIIFQYKWNTKADSGASITSDVPGTDIFIDDVGGSVHCIYRRDNIEKAAMALAKGKNAQGEDIKPIYWSNRNDGFKDIKGSFEEAFGYLVKDTQGSTGASDERSGTSWAQIATDTAFVAKVNEVKQSSGKSDPIEEAEFDKTGAYGWISKPGVQIVDNVQPGTTLPPGATWIVKPVPGTGGTPGTPPEEKSMSGLHAEESDQSPKLSTCTEIPAEYKTLGGVHKGKWDPKPEYKVEYRIEFRGWDKDSVSFESVAKYDIDTMIKVKVHGGPYYYTFTNDVTPVKYSRKEKRAIISQILSDDPSRNYFTKEDGSKVMLLDEIKSLVEQTPEWASGYQTYVITSSGKIMIEGLFIKDNYTVGDDDVDYTRGWCNGMEGSVNAYTKIERGESDSYGDDCYLVDEDSVLQIQGYTNAMIFDGEHAVSAELNAYDYPQVNAIHSDGSVIVSDGVDIQCNSFMVNRASGEPYNGSGPYNHCVDVVACDRDIILEGLNNLIQEEIDPDTNPEDEGGAGQNIIKRKKQPYQVFEPMTTDIVGKIELWYRSPVLNYRFNLEDPDAKTSIYELLPDCNPRDKYLHVVLLHVYYARNVYITDGPNPEMLNGTPQPGFNYVSAYGDNPIATYGDNNLLDDNPDDAEGLYKWTLKMWQNPSFMDNGWYLDDYIWFQAEKMMKDIPYHDELPDPDMQPFYGLVNGRYTSKRQDGKQDLLVQVPQFNIPETVRDYYIHYGGSRNPINWDGDGTHPLKIYIVVTEFHPKDALVEYKWDKECRWTNPNTGRVNDDVTQDYKGCYATFSSDSVTMKDIEYYDLVQTINFENQEVFDTKNNVIHYQIEKPRTEYTYVNYYLKVSTDNSDVMALNYPSEIMFDENGHSDFGVTYKGVVNATTKWSPRIHNGYYYLNQHEYFAYSEFNFDRDRTNVEHNDFEKCITISGYVMFDVTLCHKAPPPEIYRGNNAIVKDSRSTLLQNEKQFQWVDGKGVTLKPVIDGEYYKEYVTYLYYSPVLTFPNKLTTHGPVSIDFFVDGGTSDLMGIEIRSYILEEGKWSSWYPLAGVETPYVANTRCSIPSDVPYSHAYQLRFPLQASVTNTAKIFEDYLCCYLDWKDDGEESASYNIVTITDHMTTGPYPGKGVYVSRIFDYGCITKVTLDIFQSYYNDRIRVYTASSFDKSDLYVENAIWEDITFKPSINARYFRYKIEIPEGEKLYWLHKRVSTRETEAILPYVRGFRMEGEHHPTDIITNFINTESFEIVANGNYQKLEELNDITRIIGDDVLQRGYDMNEIKKVDITCTSDNVTLAYNSNLLNEYPGSALKDSQLRAKAPYQTSTDIRYTPFIFLDDDDSEYDKITIYGATPQQYCPITVEDPNGLSYIQLHECTDFEQSFKVVCKEKTKYIELPSNRYDYFTIKVKINGALVSDSSYKIVNHIIIFNDFLDIGDSIEVNYYIMNSFIAQVERYGDDTTPPNTVIYLYTGYCADSESLNSIFGSGIRFSHTHSDWSDHISLPEENSWYWDNNLKSFVQSKNTNHFNGFVTKEKYDCYVHACTIKSTDGDNDANGIVIGYVLDDSGQSHTLTAICDRGGLGSNNLAIWYNYRHPNSQLLTSKPLGSTGPWSDAANGITFEIKKYKNIISVRCSGFDKTTFDDSFNINIDLDEYSDWGKLFSSAVHYGYCNCSQARTFYQDVRFTGMSYVRPAKKYKVFFETSTRNNKFTASNLSLNPMYRTDYSGFIYLTDDNNEPYTVKIYCNPRRIQAGGFDKVDVSVEVLDILGNPIINKEVYIDCGAVNDSDSNFDRGIINCDNNMTDMNGVVHFIYESSVLPVEAKIRASVFNCAGAVIEDSITIVNE